MNYYVRRVIEEVNTYSPGEEKSEEESSTDETNTSTCLKSLIRRNIHKTDVFEDTEVHNKVLYVNSNPIEPYISSRKPCSKKWLLADKMDML